FLTALFLAAVSLSSFAQVESQINFRGQNSEVIKIEKNINVVRPVPYEVPSTCTRDIPYQSYECRNVTRHRQECHYVPDAQNCWTENERVCRNVTRYRQECHTGPSRQVCHERPSREVCVERPTREVCRTNSQGQETCQTVGGGQSCQTVGGGQSCDTVGGEQICRDVSYTDQDCDNVPRRRCENVPGHNVCRDIPYSEEVCGNETRYRQEEYACMRTLYRDVTTAKKLTGDVQVHFQTNGLVEEFPLHVSVAAPDAKFESFAAAVKLLKEPKVLVFLKKKNVKATETAKEINLQGSIVLEILEANMVTPSFPENLKNAAFNESNSVLSLAIEGGISAQGTVDAKVTANPKIGRDKLVAELKASYPSDRAGVAGSTLNLNLAGIMQNDLAKKNSISIKLTAPFSAAGELLNAKKPVMEKSYNLQLRK
ncbi:MAG: hypothetical protein H0V66_12925, partial [Bdellovibrionales bacterium]|nr:hypothetical protein [Bdellovibrionales bacterium]